MSENNEFSFTLTEEEKEYLLSLARWSILKKLKNESLDPLPAPPTERLRQEFGAFVTLKKEGQLRGCIGRLVGDTELYQVVSNMALNAAFNDHRFQPLAFEEFEKLEIDISILSPIVPCPDPQAVLIGRHGLVIRMGGRSGLLLPQVAEERGWDVQTFWEHTCLKAGLPRDAWKDPEAQLLWFEAEVF